MDFASQTVTFFITIITGLLLGVLFDFYRTLRNQIKLPLLLGSLADLGYWAAATVVVLAGLLLGNWGELRFYVFIGLVGGVFLYYRLLSRWALRLIALAFRGIAAVSQGLRLAVLYGLAKPIGYCLTLLFFPFTALGRIGRRWYRHCYRPKPPGQ
ncbi:MAG: spore cortex biosynthesis protein YabQ [Veillonellales bacterium]